MTHGIRTADQYAMTLPGPDGATVYVHLQRTDDGWHLEAAGRTIHIPAHYNYGPDEMVKLIRNTIGTAFVSRDLLAWCNRNIQRNEP